MNSKMNRRACPPSHPYKPSHCYSRMKPKLGKQPTPRTEGATKDSSNSNKSAPVAEHAEPPSRRQQVATYLAQSAKANLLSPRHYLRQHLDALHGPGHRAIVGGMRELYRTRLAAARRKGRVESFDAARRRLKLSDRELYEQLERFKNAHLAMYVLSSALLIYAVWLGVCNSYIGALTTFVLAGGGYVHGYLLGFRAWQIEHRSLLPLKAALRKPGTYLVL